MLLVHSGRLTLDVRDAPNHAKAIVPCSVHHRLNVATVHIEPAGTWALTARDCLFATPPVRMTRRCAGVFAALGQSVAATRVAPTVRDQISRA
jgi:hypothetical protein